MAILNDLRIQIDEIDNQIIDLLSKRRSISQQVANRKKNSNIPVRDTSREQQLIESRVNYAETLGMDTSYVFNIFKAIIEDSVITQNKIIDSND